MPKLIIKKTNSKDETNIVKTVCNYLTNDKTVHAKNVNTKIKDTVIINCMNREGVEKIEKNLKSSLNENFKVEIDQINKPTMKVIGIDKQFTTKEEEEADINRRNFSNMDEKCKVLHIFTNQKSNSAIVEITSSIYKHIKENRSELLIGYQNCRAYDIINTNPCNKCAGYGHGGKKCINKVMCYTCGGPHEARKCNSEICDYKTVTIAIKNIKQIIM